MSDFDERRLHPRWAPRLPMAKIRSLYEGEAAGLLDEELLDELGTRLFLRCESIALIRRIQHERLAYCQACDELFPRTPDWENLVRCPNCGRSSTWQRYWSTFRHKELAGTPELLDMFMSSWKRARSPADKMLAFDRAIHSWHHENDARRALGRPWAVNLIEGSRSQVIQFLEALTYEGSNATAAENDRRWREGLARVRQTEARWSRAKAHKQPDGD